MLDRCELSDLATDQCAHCRGLDDPEAPPERVVRSLIVAKFDGRCGFCSMPTHEGEPLYLVEEIGGRQKVWTGECCAGDL